MGTPLNFLPDRFLDRTGQHLLCATHGALFRIADGFFLEGPCAGKGLRPLAMRVEQGEILLAEPQWHRGEVKEFGRIGVLVSSGG